MGARVHLDESIALPGSISSQHAERPNPCPYPVHPHGRHRIFSPPEGTAPTVPFHGRRFAQRTKAKAPAFPTPESLASERIRILHEYSWRGAPGGGRRTRISSPEYCYISGHQCLCLVAHSVLEHRLSARSVATFITKRAALLRSQRLGSRLWWSAAMEGTVGRRGCKPWVAIGGELPAMLDMDFGESPQGELLRILLPRTPVNISSGAIIALLAASQPAW